MTSHKPGRLLIISNMSHHYRDGAMVGHGPTAREISHLPQLFDEVVHIGCLHQDAAPASELPYDSDRIHFVALPPAGGTRLIDKLGILWLVPRYIRTIIRELPKADYVHVRCPANIPLLALLILIFARHPAQERRWVKYAGNWKPQGGEAWSYTFQRWLLRSGLTRSQVTVNGEWPGDPDHVHTFLNPCLTAKECEEGAVAAAAKRLIFPLQLLFVGSLNRAKGVIRLIEVAARLKTVGLPFHLDFVGDGPEGALFQEFATKNGLNDFVTFHGALPRTALGGMYASAHFLMLPSSSEGWPKVLSEGMAYGVVPIASDVSSIGQYLRRFGTGRALQPEDLDEFVNAIMWYAQNPEEWAQEAQRGVQAAQHFTYDAYLDAVADLFGLRHRSESSAR